MKKLVLVLGGTMVLLADKQQFAESATIKTFLEKTFGPDTHFTESPLKRSSELTDEDLNNALKSVASDAEEQQSTHVFILVGASIAKKVASYFDDKFAELPSCVSKILIVSAPVSFTEDPVPAAVAIGMAIATAETALEDMYIITNEGLAEYVPEEEAVQSNS